MRVTNIRPPDHAPFRASAGLNAASVGVAFRAPGNLVSDSQQNLQALQLQASLRSAPEQPISIAAPAVETFDAYYRRDYHKLVGLAYVISGSHTMAEDLVQEALTEAHKRWSEVGAYEKPGAWVRKVIVNKNTSRFRRLRSETKALVRIGSRPIEVIQPTEQTHEVWDAVRQLPARQAQTVALHYWEGWSIPEISEVLGLSVETTRTHLKRARAKLATQLAGLREDGS